MKKITLLLAIGITFSFSVHAQTTAITDAAFEQELIDDGVDTDGVVNGLILTADAEAVTGTLNVEGAATPITNLTGIEAFINMTQLFCGEQQITGTLDVTSCVSLTRLNCDQNLLTSLNVANLSLLEQLYAYGNNLTTQDLTTNPVLRILYIYDNPNLSSLNLTGITTSLERLYTYNTSLVSIDATPYTAMERLYVNDTPSLTSIDVTGLTAMSRFECQGTSITTLDLSTNSALTNFECNNNSLLTSVDLKNGANTSISTYISTTTPNLTCVQVDDAAYSSANWTAVDPATTFVVDCTTLGVDRSTLFNYSLFPNPVKNQFKLNLDREASYAIINVTGQITTKGDLSIGENEIDISDLKAGLYFIKISDNSDLTLTAKIVKK